MNLELWYQREIERKIPGAGMIRAQSLAPREPYHKVEFVVLMPKCASLECDRPAAHMIAELFPACDSHMDDYEDNLEWSKDADTAT